MSRAVTAGVDQYVAAGNRYRRRVSLSPRGGPDRSILKSPDETNAWGRQVGDVLARLMAAPDIKSVDLFLACPVERGRHRLVHNATGPVQLMNWAAKTGPFEAMWRLP